MSYKDLSLYQKKIGCSVGELAKTIKKTIAPLMLKDFCILNRIKNPDTLKKKKHLKKVKSVFEIEDVYAFRLLVSNINEVYMVSKLIMGMFDSYLDHNYIQNPKIRPDVSCLKGKSLRLLQMIAYKNEVPFEIQITTFKFNESNELLHERYHNEKYS